MILIYLDGKVWPGMKYKVEKRFPAAELDNEN